METDAIDNSSMYDRFASAGSNFLTFVDQNSFNLFLAISGSALIANQSLVAGVALATFGSFNIISNAVTAFPEVPRDIRQFFDRNSFPITILAVHMALVATQCHFLVISSLIFCSYQFLDAQGLIPREMSLMMERYFPWWFVFKPPLIYDPISAAMSFSSMAFYVPPILQFTYDKFDALTRKLFTLEGPSLQEVRQNTVENQHLTLEEINDILNDVNGTLKFSFDLEHCSKPAASYATTLTSDEDFNKLKTIAAKISWEEQKDVICDQSDFVSYLQEQFPWDKDVKEKKEQYVAQLAKRKGITIGAVANEWIHDRLERLSDLLNGNYAIRVKGSQNDLHDAIQDIAKIIPYIESQQAAHPAEVKRLLLQLTLGSSGENASKIKKVAAEVLHTVAKEHLENVNPTLDNLANRYKFEIFNTLHMKRKNIVLDRARASAKFLTKAKNLFSISKKEEFIPKKVEEEKLAATESQYTDFFMDLHQRFLSFGFLPLSNYDKNNPNLPVQYMIRYFNFAFEVVCAIPSAGSSIDAYEKRINDPFISMQKDKFWEVVDKLLHANHVDVADRARIYKRFRIDPDNKKTIERFQRLNLALLGIYKKTT
jgi:hypothetical protein